MGKGLLLQRRDDQRYPQSRHLCAIEPANFPCVPEAYLAFLAGSEWLFPTCSQLNGRTVSLESLRTKKMTRHARWFEASLLSPDFALELPL